MIPHNRLTLGPEERLAAERVLESGWLAQGREVEAFENEFCAFLGLTDACAVAVSSGTAALYLALWVMGAGGSTVACPVYACSAITNAIALAGASPVFMDTAPDSPNIEAAALARSGAPIAVVPHMFGFPVDLPVAGKIRFIEDCAQSLGARIGGAPVGLRGVAGIFSFSATKLITSGGQGGLLVSRDQSIVDAIRDYRAFDCRDDRKPRFNLQMTDLQAAIGRTQLRRLPCFVRRRAEIFERYRSEGLCVVEPSVAGVPVRYRSIIRAREPWRLIDHLSASGINAIVPVNDWELLAPGDQFPHASHFARTTVSLPTYPSLTDPELQSIIGSLTGSAWR